MNWTKFEDKMPELKQNILVYHDGPLKIGNKWEERFNVILANPPFMTPKGGIKPHKKFRLKANRAEVLFVDYID